MTIRVAACLVLAGLVLTGLALAQPSQDSLTTTGTVVSAGDISMVVRIDDGFHPIPFVIGTTTALPSGGLTVGSRVSVRYHPLGSTGQMADEVTPLRASSSGAVAGSAPRQTPSESPRLAQSATPPATDGDHAQAAPSPTEQPPGTSSRLPATASPLPLLALTGMAALVGSLSLRALARRRV